MCLTTALIVSLMADRFKECMQSRSSAVQWMSGKFEGVCAVTAQGSRETYASAVDASNDML